MAIYTDCGRALMAKSFYTYASGVNNPITNNKSPLWFGFARGLTNPESLVNPDFSWESLVPINSGTAITTDTPPDPILYPGPKSQTLVNTESTSSLPVKYKNNYSYSPVVYKRVNFVQYIKPDPNGEIYYLENRYTAYDTEEDAMDENCNLVRVVCSVSSIELHQVGIDPTNLTTRQIGLYKDIDTVFGSDTPATPFPPSHPDLLVSATDLGGHTEAEFGLSLIDNTMPYPRVEYQRDVFSFVLQF